MNRFIVILIPLLMIIIVGLLYNVAVTALHRIHAQNSTSYNVVPSTPNKFKILGQEQRQRLFSSSLGAAKHLKLRSYCQHLRKRRTIILFTLFIKHIKNQLNLE